MELFALIVKKPLTIFAKIYILDVWKGSEFTSVPSNLDPKLGGNAYDSTIVDFFCEFCDFFRTATYRTPVKMVLLKFRYKTSTHNTNSKKKFFLTYIQYYNDIVTVE